jgi:hypothetical protein
LAALFKITPFAFFGMSLQTILIAEISAANITAFHVPLRNLSRAVVAFDVVILAHGSVLSATLGFFFHDLGVEFQVGSEEHDIGHKSNREYPRYGIN